MAHARENMPAGNSGRLLDLKSLAASPPATAYRGYFHSNVVGILPPALHFPNPRTRLLGETNGVRRYEVLLEVHRDVMAYGILCVPADLEAPVSGVQVLN